MALGNAESIIIHGWMRERYPVQKALLIRAHPNLILDVLGTRLTVSDGNCRSTISTDVELVLLGERVIKVGCDVECVIVDEGGVWTPWIFAKGR